MSEFDWVERNRGILTQRDRRFLRGDLDKDLNDNEKSQKRFQIRKRIRNAMFDFHIIERALEPRDVAMLWEETDDWIYRSQTQRQRGDSPPYPEMPLLARCWRDWISLFVYSQISTGISEAELLVEWVIEEGVNKAVRKYTLSRHNQYQEVDSELDWGTGSSYRLLDYLDSIGEQIPDDADEAEEYLLKLQRGGYLQSNHVTYLFQTYVS